ncbi:glycosyltransferase [Knoellia locipacati]|uniref:glycosyltransferase n=1 Tax=Knoellia locipacati TaxID=882824 RepID=UPI00384D09C1
MTAPLVTVVVPVHDVAPYLDACVASIAAQSHVNLDIVLVDDGSRDGSEVICEQWAARDNRVRVIHQETQGSSVARNVGIEAARGAYLTFVDSDDLLSPDLVGTLLSAAEATGAQIALGELVEFSDGETVPFTRGSVPSTSTAEEELFRVICVRPQWGPVVKLFRRDLFEDGPRFPEGLLHQDLAFTPRIFERASRTARTDAVLYGHRQRSGSVTDTVQRKALSPDLITILRGNIEFARATRPPDEFQAYLAAYLRHATRQLERIRGAGAWRRNQPFLHAYRELLGSYLPEVSPASRKTALRRSSWWVAGHAPRPYAVTMRTARSVRSWLSPVIRRGR